MKMRNKKIIYLGVSIGPIATGKGNYIIKKIMQSSNLAIVRDEKSYEFLLNIKNHLKYVLSPDLVLSLEPPKNELSFKNEEVEKTLGINLMPHYSEIGNKEDLENRILHNLVELIRVSPEVKIKFFQFQNQSSMNDKKTYDKLIKVLEKEKVNKRIEFIKYVNVENLTSEMLKCDFFIGMRLHSSVICDVLRIPHIMLSYHPKGIGYAQILKYSETMIINCDTAEEYFNEMKHLLIAPSEFLVDKSVKETQMIIENTFNKVNEVINLK